MALAVLLDPVGQGPETPILDLAELAALGGQDLAERVGERLGLLGGEVGASDDGVLVEGHARRSSFPLDNRTGPASHSSVPGIRSSSGAAWSRAQTRSPAHAARGSLIHARRCRASPRRLECGQMGGMREFDPALDLPHRVACSCTTRKFAIPLRQRTGYAMAGKPTVAQAEAKMRGCTMLFCCKEGLV